RAGVGRRDAKHLARAEVVERLLGLDDRQRAVQAARVEFLVEIHPRYSFVDRPALAAAPRARGSSREPDRQLRAIAGTASIPWTGKPCPGSSVPALAERFGQPGDAGALPGRLVRKQLIEPRLPVRARVRFVEI